MFLQAFSFREDRQQLQVLRLGYNQIACWVVHNGS